MPCQPRCPRSEILSCRSPSVALIVFIIIPPDGTQAHVHFVEANPRELDAERKLRQAERERVRSENGKAAATQSRRARGASKHTTRSESSAEMSAMEWGSPAAVARLRFLLWRGLRRCCSSSAASAAGNICTSS